MRGRNPRQHQRPRDRRLSLAAGFAVLNPSPAAAHQDVAAPADQVQLRLAQRFDLRHLLQVLVRIAQSYFADGKLLILAHPTLDHRD